MSNFKLTIEGLDNVKQAFKTDERMQKIVPDISIAILKFHNTLENRVSSLFTNKKQLTSVMIGRSVTPSSLGKTFLRYSLQYQDVPVPLSDYSVTEANSDSVSVAPTRRPPSNPKGFVKWKPGRYSKDYRVAVRKGNGRVQNVKGIKSFPFRTPNSDLLLARTKQTWHFRPTKGKLGTRTKLKIMYGPSLANLASSVYDRDKQTAQALDKMQNDIVKAFLRY